MAKWHPPWFAPSKRAPVRRTVIQGGGLHGLQIVGISDSVDVSNGWRMQLAFTTWDMASFMRKRLPLAFKVNIGQVPKVPACRPWCSSTDGDAARWRRPPSTRGLCPAPSRPMPVKAMISPGASAPLGHVVKQVVHHVGVGAEITRGKQHGLLASASDIFRQVLGVRAQHRIAVQLEGDGGMLPPHSPQPLRFAHAVGFKLGDAAHLLAAFDEPCSPPCLGIGTWQARSCTRKAPSDRRRPRIAIGNLDDALIVIEVRKVARIGVSATRLSIISPSSLRNSLMMEAHAPHASAGVLGHDVADIVRAESVSRNI